jgi:peptidyl-prolyl cis-trans isomerase D
MATLEKIRSKAGIAAAAVIGLALLGFILQDLFDSRKSLFRSSKNDIGKIAGDEIPLQRFQQTEAEMTENYKLLYNVPSLDDKMQDQVREQAWQQIINEEVMDKEFKKVGLTVSSDELAEMFIGPNPHPFIKQMFTNPQTGEFSRAAVSQFLKMTDDDQPITNEDLAKKRQIRLYLEKELLNQRINVKYINLIAKGLSAPKFLAQNEATETDKKVDFNFIVQRYTSISDAAVKYTNSDLEKYYKEHKYLYEQTASRDIEYVSFDILPSDEDREAVEKDINKIKPDFVAATEVEDFVRPYNPYEDKNYKQSDLPDSVGKFMFSAKVGEVYGPYFENGSYKLARLYKIVELPDSVKARHILLAVKDPAQAENIKKMADSLKTVIEKGGNFEALAKQYSDDKGSAEKGGDLGWFKEGAMVKPFNDAAFESKKNEIKVIQTQFGYHILQVLDKSKDTKKVKVAFIELKLDPSKATYDKIYGAAMKFASENRTYQQFNASVTKQNLLKKPAYNIPENAKSIEGLDDARPIVKWAYSAKPNDVSEPITIGNDKYVVAALVNAREKGIAPLEQVKNQVELEVRKQKKAEMLVENINKAKAGVKTIQDLALKLNTPVETALGLNFNSFSIPNAGVEPKIIAIATNYAKDKLSRPFDGNNGVYVLYVTNIVNPPSTDYSEYLQRLDASYATKAYESTQALIKAANIEDNRSLFY